MKKIFKTLPLALIVMSIISCSSDENVGQDNNNPTQVVTFTCTQEQDANATRSELNPNATQILWQKNDKISIFDGTVNNQFTLKDESAGNKSGSFTGTCSESNSYVAVYPFTEGAELKEGKVEGIKLPATQKAVAGSFDPTASLMIAKSSTKQLEFKNAVGWVKVTTDFACSKIELRAPGELIYIAGKGTLSYNDANPTNANPTIDFTSEQSRTITLVPKSAGGTIAAGTYYIVVPAVKLYAGWRITFTDASDSKEYIRRGNNEITFKRKTIIDLGEFKKSETPWLDPVHGIVPAEKEIDMGLTVRIGDKSYNVIFAPANLTATGLAEKESDCGDYFAWGATEPWYNSYTIGNEGKPIVESDKWKKTGGYTIGNSPYRVGDAYTKYNDSGVTLEATDDPARQILGGDWKLPTLEIWNKLSDTKNYKWEWTTKDSYKGYQVTSQTYASKTIFLPAASYVDGTRFNYSNNSYNNGYYWSGTLYIPSDASRLYFTGDYINAKDSYGDRRYGYSVRPVRLVAVD